MSARDFLSDLAEVGKGYKYDIIITTLGLSDDDPGASANDAGDAAKVLIGQGDFPAFLGLSVAAYGKALDLLQERHDRIEAGLEGAEDRGRELANSTISENHPDGVLSDVSLRAYSDASAEGILHYEDARSSEYRESFYEAFAALRETRDASAFRELENQRRAVAQGFGNEVTKRCEAEWGHPTAAAARDAGILEPLDAEVHQATAEGEHHEPASEGTTASGTATPDNTELEPESDATTNADLEMDAAADSEPAIKNGGAVNSAATNAAARPDEPSTPEAYGPYLTGDGDLAAQDQGHDAWFDKEAAEDTALAASAAAVDEPTAYNDPETYTSDGDMKALTEPYDWEAEQFDEGATLFDEPATDAAVITPEQPVTVPGAEVREPDEPEV